MEPGSPSFASELNTQSGDTLPDERWCGDHAAKAAAASQLAMVEFINNLAHSHAVGAVEVGI